MPELPAGHLFGGGVAMFFGESAPCRRRRQSGRPGGTFACSKHCRLHLHRLWTVSAFDVDDGNTCDGNDADYRPPARHFTYANILVMLPLPPRLPPFITP